MHCETFLRASKPTGTGGAMNATYQGPPLKLSSEGPRTSTIRQLSDMSSDDIWRAASGEQAQPDLPSFAGRWDVVPHPQRSGQHISCTCCLGLAICKPCVSGRGAIVIVRLNCLTRVTCRPAASRSPLCQPQQSANEGLMNERYRVLRDLARRVANKTRFASIRVSLTS